MIWWKSSPKIFIAKQQNFKIFTQTLNTFYKEKKKKILSTLPLSTQMAQTEFSYYIRQEAPVSKLPALRLLLATTSERTAGSLAQVIPGNSLFEFVPLSRLQPSLAHLTRSTLHHSTPGTVSPFLAARDNLATCN